MNDFLQINEMPTFPHFHARYFLFVSLIWGQILCKEGGTVTTMTGLSVYCLNIKDFHSLFHVFTCQWSSVNFHDEFSPLKHDTGFDCNRDSIDWTLCNHFAAITFLLRSFSTVKVQLLWRLQMALVFVLIIWNDSDFFSCTWLIQSEPR